MILTWKQFLRAWRLPFSPGGRNFLMWQFVDRGCGLWLVMARIYRLTLARRMTVVVVTGTYGKTTMVRAITAAVGGKIDHWSARNANCVGLVGWSLLRHPPWHRVVVIETGVGGPGCMRPYLKALRPNVAVVTCVGEEHMVAFDSFEHLRAEKAEVVRYLGLAGRAVLNCDDPNVRWMAGHTSAQVVLYGFAEEAQVQGTAWRNRWPRGSELEVSVEGTTIRLETRLQGRQSAGALMAALAVGRALGVATETSLRALTQLPPTPGRMQCFATRFGGWCLRDDYKASPPTVHAALDALEGIPGRRIVILGGLDMPVKPMREAYRHVAQHASRMADVVIVVGRIRAFYVPELRRQLSSDARMAVLHQAHDVQEVMAWLETHARPDDVVLVKGRKIERLARIGLYLEGREVRCAVHHCRLHIQNCDDCAFLNQPGAKGGIRLDERIVDDDRKPMASISAC